MNPEDIQERERLYFAGLTDTDNATLPDWYSRKRNISDDDVLSLTEVINNRLPNAQRANLSVENPLDDEDADPDPIDDWVAIVDPQRARLASDGHDIKYTWHVPTDKYTIVPPIEAYSPLVSALREHDLEDAVFGEVLLRDYGGEVFIRMVFESKKITGLPGDDNAPVYLGLETGYDFKGGRAIYSQLIGFDSYSAGVIRNITEKRTRRHVGDATNEAHERKHDRTPIQQWWNGALNEIDAMTDDLTEAIRTASQQSLAFTRGGQLVQIPKAYKGSFDHVKPYDAASFFTLHDMPDYLAQKAAARSADHGDGIENLTFWELFRGLTQALEDQDRCDEGSTLNAYADTAMDLLWNPTTVVELADEQWNYELKQEGVETDDAQQIILSRDAEEGEANTNIAAEIGNTVEEDEDKSEGVMSKRELAQQRQQSLRDFAQDVTS